ncbi:hypothetical protein ACFLTE_08725 [Bacteroidota bacterium]
MNDRSINSRLLKAEVAISNSRSHEEVKEQLAVFGYDDTMLMQGYNLYNEAARKQESKVKEYAEQYEATNQLDKAKADAHKVYMKYLKVARVAFTDHVKFSETLMLNGRRKLSYTGWLEQAEMFYSQALSNNEILAGLAKFGITKNKLKQGEALVTEVRNNLKTQLTEKAEAQEATQNRDIAFDVMEKWLGDFTEIARIALDENSQYLEMLGIIEPS